MQFIAKSRRSPFINIISLIDVLVVLLIFYIATTVFKKAQPNININLATSPAAIVTTGTPPSILYVTADDRMFLDADPVDADQLGSLLKSKVAANPKFRITLKPDTKMTFGTLSKIIDASREAGLGDLRTFMDKPKATGASVP